MPTLTPQRAPSVVSMPTADDREQRGRRWLIWSFILCPCHLPITLGVVGVVFGGSALGTLVSQNQWGVGLALTAIYAVGLAIGLRHVHAANKLRSCAVRGD